MALLPFPGGQSGAYRDPDEDEGLGFSVLAHLDDLRKRLIYSASAVAVGVVVGFVFIDRAVNFMLAPTRSVLPPGSNQLIYTQPGEAFGLYIQIAIILGIVVAMPFIMYQLWRLVAPLVPRAGKKFAIPFVLMSTIGFIVGALFNHFVIFPFMMRFFASFNTPDLVFLPKVQDVFDLYMKMVLGMGAIFQMPTVVFFFSKFGLITARFLWRNLKLAVLVIFVLAAVITPSGDMATQTIFAAPMIGLYILSIFIAWVFGKPRATDDEK
jgi:sec-independent protein translocase protein TatC